MADADFDSEELGGDGGGFDRGGLSHRGVGDDEDVSGGRWPRGIVPLAWALLLLLAGSAVVVAVVAFIDDDPLGDPGRLSEATYLWQPEDGALPALVDVTADWGLSSVRTTGDHPIRGGAAIGDVDGDGRDDIVIGGGTLTLALWSGSGYEVIDGSDVVHADVVGVNIADVDADGLVDLLVSTTGDDVIVWGGSWDRTTGISIAAISTLSGSDATGALIVADLDGDGTRDVVQLGNGINSATPDLIHHQNPDAPRSFSGITELPGSRRFSMTAELIDADGDGLLDIWVTRDVGWRAGPNSVYSRLGNPSGPWVDIAESIGADHAIDGMGITAADLDGDRRLDIYLSDLGDNQILTQVGSSWLEAPAMGLARIRPADADLSRVSSSWASGAADLNLDGRLDLVIVHGGFRDRPLTNKIEGTFVEVEDPPAILLARPDGTYADVWPDLAKSWAETSRGLALGDLDGDGDTDLVIVNHNAGITVFRNDSEGSSTTLALDSACVADGAVGELVGETGAVVARLGGHSFLGRHGARLTSGGTDLDVSVTAAGGAAFTYETRVEGNRTFVTAHC